MVRKSSSTAAPGRSRVRKTVPVLRTKAESIARNRRTPRTTIEPAALTLMPPRRVEGDRTAFFPAPVRGRFVNCSIRRRRWTLRTHEVARKKSPEPCFEKRRGRNHRLAFAYTISRSLILIVCMEHPRRARLDQSTARTCAVDSLSLRSNPLELFNKGRLQRRQLAEYTPIRARNPGGKLAVAVLVSGLMVVPPKSPMRPRSWG